MTAYDFISFLMENPISLLVITVVIPLLYWIYQKTRSRKKITFQEWNYLLATLGDIPIEGLKMTYDGHEIHDLSVAYLAIWNKGEDVIKREDIVSGRPLCIKTSYKADRVLDMRILYSSAKARNFSLSWDPENKRILIDFDNVESGAGIVVWILYSGGHQEGLCGEYKTPFDVDGEIIAGKEIRYNDSGAYSEIKFYLCVLLPLCGWMFLFAILVNVFHVDLNSLPRWIAFCISPFIVTGLSFLAYFLTEMPFELRTRANGKKKGFKEKETL